MTINKHQHGARGAVLHALATTSAQGMMDPADLAKLNLLSSNIIDDVAFQGTGTTVGLTSTTLYTYTPPDLKLINLIVRAYGIDAAGGLGVVYRKLATFFRNGSTTSRVGSGTRTITLDSEDSSTPDVVVNIAANGIDIEIVASGRSGNTFSWRCKGRVKLLG